MKGLTSGIISTSCVVSLAGRSSSWYILKIMRDFTFGITFTWGVDNLTSSPSPWQILKAIIDSIVEIDVLRFGGGNRITSFSVNSTSPMSGKTGMVQFLKNWLGFNNDDCGVLNE
ncbi:hypothetical protein HNY73_021033 [Argiope bruennichi]|uniref:Uncharacterized protein n=1 Tax=Argiope bruennichi TaxID=94029 RepID=A0A8T0E9X6_ARGBR|nr:hypothetical protein HNY73_021033 [Argiope bruennichi]